MELSVKNGCFSYNSGAEILKNINFNIKSGDMLAVLGPNGAGKTTLLRCITGLLKWKSGSTLLGGTDICKIPPKTLWKTFAYVPQTKQTGFTATAEEMILLGRAGSMGLVRRPGNADFDIADAVMRRLHIESLKNKRCNEISGGELQMVLIARALAAQPQILVLDEPESNLDFKNQLTVLDAMSALTSENTACIFNTHFPAHALQRANKALLVGGKTVLFGDTSEIVTEKNIEAAFKVKTVIGEIETDTTVKKDIIPLCVSNETDGNAQQNADRDRLAVMTVTAKDSVPAQRINGCLYDFRQYIVSRMGLPYKKYNLRIINLTLDGPESKLKSLAARLGCIQGINVKTIYEESGDVTNE